jgi:uncharacterized protein (DUF983 family)
MPNFAKKTPMSSFLFKTRIYSVFTNTCPVCHEGQVFTHKNFFNLKQFDKMHINCPVCEHKNEKEPGFFYGAMFVSYGLMVGLFLVSFVTFVWGLKVKMSHYLIGFPFLVLLFTPLVYRTSRLIWMNFFTGYKGNKK